MLTAAAAAFLCGNGIARATEPDDAAAQYCVKVGGKVIVRAPVYGTNGPKSSWLLLAGLQNFCEFVNPKDHSTIHILADTLYTMKPSLAALAYYLKPPMNPPGPGNPASYYCSQLGGSDLFGGVNAAGGAWVGQDPPYDRLEACIFPDMSSIDSWGLTYNTAGIIRGIDLTTVMRYKGPPQPAQ